MGDTLSTHQVLIYAMVTMSAVDRSMTDLELREIGNIVQILPIFRGFDPDELVTTAEECGQLLGEEGGLDQVLDLIAETLPKRLYDTVYALAVDVAAADLTVEQEELRFLQMLRDHLNLDKLTVAAIERAARARHALL